MLGIVTFCYNPPMTKLHITSNGYKLAGTIFPATQPSKLAFLFIQGWKGHQNVKAAQRLAELGFTSMTYDMHGNGESEGNLANFSRADFISDAVNAYDYLTQQVAEGTKIGVIGSSFGSYTSVLLSAEREVHCLSLRVPASYPDEGFEDPQLPQAGSNALQDWRAKELHYSGNRAFQTLHDFAGEVLIIEAGADEDVPRQAPQNYANAMADKSRLQYAVMDSAPHTLANDELRAEYERLLSDWAKSIKV
jgi:esterase/lipase